MQTEFHPHHLAAATPKLAAPPSEKDLPPAPIVEPRLWIIAAAASAPMLRKLDARPAPGWPAGVYFHGGDLHRVGLVVADELPRNRSTLLVRLMAAGPGLPAALADLAALPEDAHARALSGGSRAPCRCALVSG